MNPFQLEIEARLDMVKRLGADSPFELNSIKLMLQIGYVTAVQVGVLMKYYTVKPKYEIDPKTKLPTDEIKDPGDHILFQGKLVFAFVV